MTSPLPTSEGISGPRPGAVPAALAEQVTRGLSPVWEQAHQLTHTALTVERASTPASTVTAPPSGAVRNTFNVNVHLDPSAPQEGLDRRTLEDALVDILRETARRHGLEV
ncbi:hypothetical protein JRI60_32260 [Archangium violaceum]|uniref:hypothetical protein n=1 Tax=Archangium violaceum TaxID=83451 RepID=UPI00194F6363|nr:hypothetical protein [Archangium violaceum]QRN93820.1 hypothetical protein JRI60_32260 [Archangium violaceum]